LLAISTLEDVREAFEPSADILSLMTGSRPATVLSIDIGTSGVRAALFDEWGGEIDGAAVRVPRTVSSSSDLAELDADAAVQLVIQTIDLLFAQAYISTAPLELISLSCFWHSMVGIDANGAPTTPVLGWADTRGAHFAQDLRRRFNEKEFHSRTGCRFHPSYWPAKLLWLRNAEPEAVSKTSQWLSFSDYLAFHLCGKTLTSVSMASATGLFDQRKGRWDAELLQALEITSSCLPTLAGRDETLKLNEEFRLRWPQLSNARIFPAIGDGAANNIGSSCTERDRVALMIGTSGAMRVLYEGEPPDELPDQLWCYRADDLRVVIGGALSDGGGLHSWLREALHFKEDDEALENQLMEMEPDTHGLTILPFWTGERSPGWAPQAQGAILGLTLRTRPIEILRAAMEAVAYQFASIASALEKLAPGAAIIASGNALRSSPAWVQIIADVIGRPVALSVTREASTRGAALLGLEAAGKINTIEQSSFAVGQIFEPDNSRYGRYQEALERQEKAHKQIFGASAV